MPSRVVVEREEEKKAAALAAKDAEDREVIAPEDGPLAEVEMDDKTEDKSNEVSSSSKSS